MSIHGREYQKGNKNVQPRETGTIRYTRRRKTQHNMCRAPLYATKHK